MAAPTHAVRQECNFFDGLTLFVNFQRKIVRVGKECHFFACVSRVFGTRYAVLALPCGGTVPDAALCKELRTLYKVMVPHPYYRGQVIFYGS